MNVRISDEWRDKLIAAGFPKNDLCLGVAEEILRRLPQQTSEDDFLCISPEENGWAMYYDTRELPIHIQKADTLVNAAASMWIHLKENNILPARRPTDTL